MHINLNLITAYVMALVYLAAAVAFAVLGFEWIYTTYGVNPWVAFPLSTLCVITGVSLPMYFMDVPDIDIERDIETLLEGRS